MRTIAAEWDTYAQRVLPANAPEIQRTECKRAFYAGAIGMLATVQNLGEDDVSEDAGVAILQGLADEAERFAEDIMQGRA